MPTSRVVMRSRARWLVALAAALTAPAATASCPPAAKGYVDALPFESDAARAARHQRVAERRAGPVVIVHRGAAAFAPENTLEAYAAAMEYGADGCEIDIRQTADGVIVLFHDDMLDRLTNGFGTVRQLTYFELLSLKPRQSYGSATPETRPPTFAALLILARERAVLLHLDVKEPGLEGEIRRFLDAAGAWDHVVAVNCANAASLRADPRLRLLSYKAPGLHENRRDIDPAAVREALARPGEMIMVDDPRVAAHVLGRPARQPRPLPNGLRIPWKPATAADPPGDQLVPQAYLRAWRASQTEESSSALMAVLAAHPEERRRPDGDPGYQRRRTERILQRAWAAQRLGELGKKSRRLVALLEELVRDRSLHRDWMYHGLDGAMAARALGMLQATEAAPTLVETFQRVDPALRQVANPEFAANPLAWTDFRAKLTILPALGELRCEASKQFLQAYLGMEEAAARRIAPPLFEETVRALMRQALSRGEIDQLLRSPHRAARGAAVLECLDRPTSDRTAALTAVAPWALELPRARPR